MARNIYWAGAAVATIALVSAASAAAQTARISGSVRDETGGTIRGAIVRATTEPRPGTSQTSLTTVTDDRGRFIFVMTRSGTYHLTFEAPGFDGMMMTAILRLPMSIPNIEIKLDRHESPEAVGALAGVDSKGLAAELASAATLLDEGHYDQAITAYRALLTKTPALTLINLPMGNAYLAKKSYAEAQAAFQEILKEDPSDANGLFAMGTLTEAQNNAAEAQSWYQKASTADPAWTRPLMRLASLARGAGDRATALRYLTQVITLDPSSLDGLQASTMQKELQ